MRTLLTALTALMLFGTIFGLSACGEAVDYEDAVAAYAAGDYRKAFRLLKGLAEQGNVDAQYNLGVMYYEGEGVPKDYVQAYAWTIIAVVQGHEDAKHNLRGITKRLKSGQIIEGQMLEYEAHLPT